MKLRKLLCRSAAALIAVSVPLVGMNAFGEAGVPAATPTGTVETEEAAEPESHALSEDEIAHQKYLHGYNYTKKDNAITVSIKEANSFSKEEYVFYARNYDYTRDFYSGLLNYYVGDFDGKFVDFIDFSADITGNATYVVYYSIEGDREVMSDNVSASGSLGGVICELYLDDSVQFSVYEAEPGVKITLQDVHVYATDYVGEIDESIDTSVPYTLKNISPFDDGYQYDVSMLPPQDGKFTIEFEPAEIGNGLRLDKYDYYGSEIDRKVPVDKGQTTAEIYVTKQDMEILRNSTVRLDSKNLKITKVTFVHEPRDPSIFEYGDNNCELTLDSKSL